MGPTPPNPRSGLLTARHDWTLDEVTSVHDLPLFDLLDRARAVHRAAHGGSEVQLCTLLSVKTGGCPEDCAYCPQSSHYETEVGPEKMLDVGAVLEAAARARAVGATRFCMGAAWREVKDGPAFDRVLDMVRGVKALGLEACCTLGMLTDEQAIRLKEAGLDAYNHNLDTSRQNYRSIITTRAYDERLATLRSVRRAGITVCSGGILGMGETVADRCAMLVELSHLDPPPESVPINALVRAPGTPLAGAPSPRPHGLRADDRHHPHRVSAGDGAPLRRADGPLPRGAAPLHVRRRELHLLRRPPADGRRTPGRTPTTRSCATRALARMAPRAEVDARADERPRSTTGACKKLVRGTHTFLANYFATHRALFEQLATNGQRPETLFITCSDSRVVPELITSAPPGELFVVRNVGNIVPDATRGLLGGVAAAIEYAVQVLEVENLIVCGHTGCGAIDAILHPERVAHLRHVPLWLAEAEPILQIMADRYPDLEGEARTRRGGGRERALAAREPPHLRLHRRAAGAGQAQDERLGLQDRDRPGLRLRPCLGC